MVNARCGGFLIVVSPAGNLERKYRKKADFHSLPLPPFADSR
ncbi:MAG: hypothetical protein MHPDNHAH_03114 [Anaerolineales bacterium]|nr:hypothetical protein [Anaerolineales bacterium]